MHSLILQTIAPVVLHLTIIFSVFLLLYGHNQPGGGFIAGLMTAFRTAIQRRRVHRVASVPQSLGRRLPNPASLVRAVDQHIS